MPVAPTLSDAWPALLETFQSAWNPEKWRHMGVVLGCSGGADSVALLRAIDQLRGPDKSDPPRGFVVVAHFNHLLRGDDSFADQQFVTELAGELGFRSEVGTASEITTDENSLREARSEFLQSVAGRYGARYITLAHSADDNVETVLYRLLRGTGPAGLTGIQPFRPVGDDLVLARPLLGMRRDRIREALSEIGQRWREDRSNENSVYRRNWIRLQLLPQIESEFPQANAAILRAIEGICDWQRVLDSLANTWLRIHFHDQNQVVLDRDPDLESAVAVQALQQLWHDQGFPAGEMNRNHWLRLAQTLSGCETERYSLPGDIDVVAQEKEVKVTRRSAGCH